MSDRFYCQHLTCGTSYATEQELAAHLKDAHKGERVAFPFGCDRCGAGYQTNVGLEVHMREAHGVVVEIPRLPEAYRCTHCGRGMASRHGLWLHSTRKHGDPAQGKRKFQKPPAKAAS